MDDLMLAHLRVTATDEGDRVWIGSGTYLFRSEVVRLHAWLAGWLAEHQPESETEAKK